MTGILERWDLRKDLFWGLGDLQICRQNSEIKHRFPSTIYIMKSDKIRGSCFEVPIFFLWPNKIAHLVQ